MIGAMNPYVIVGGGLSGLLVARVLHEKGLPFIGFERSSRLGGRVESGPTRILKNQTLEFFQVVLPHVTWNYEEGDAQERIKGEWEPLRDGYLEGERFYFTNSFYTPTTHTSEVLKNLSFPVAEKFQLQKTVIRIDGKNKILELSDGTEQSFSKLFWCSDLNLLFKLWEGDRLGTPKTQKKISEKQSGFNWILDLDAPLLNSHQTIVLPFRFKEWKLRALGVQDLDEQNAKSRLHWLVFLPKEIMEDQEEVAKTVKTLKREIVKEFPELTAKIKKEKIVYLPVMSGEEPARFSSLEIAPDLICVGPQICVEEEQSDWKNLDLVAAHVKHLKALNLEMSS